MSHAPNQIYLSAMSSHKGSMKRHRAIEGSAWVRYLADGIAVRTHGCRSRMVEHTGLHNETLLSIARLRSFLRHSWIVSCFVFHPLVRNKASSVGPGRSSICSQPPPRKLHIILRGKAADKYVPRRSLDLHIFPHSSILRRNPSPCISWMQTSFRNNNSAQDPYACKADKDPHGKGARRDADISWVKCGAYHKSAHTNVEVYLLLIEDLFPSRTNKNTTMVGYPWGGCIQDISTAWVAVYFHPDFAAVLLQPLRLLTIW